MLQLTENLDGLFRAMRLDSVLPPEDWERGIAHVKSELRRLAVDAETAVARGLKFSDAATDFENFGLLARCHAGVDDILTLSLPRELVQWVLQMVEHMDELEPQLDDLTEDLVQMAACQGSVPDPAPALAKFFLFEMVRLQLILLARRNPHEFFGRGLELEDLSVIAEKQVDTWLEDAAPTDVRSRLIMQAAACLELVAKVTEMKEELARVRHVIADNLAARARLEEQMLELEPSDSLMIRNVFAPDFGLQQLSIEELHSRHPAAMGGLSAEALHKRFQRLRKRKKVPRRKGIALLDLLRELDGEEVIK